MRSGWEPLSREICCTATSIFEVIDNVAALDAVDGALFWDFGESFLFDRRQGRMDHAVGGVLYVQIPILSFLENVTIRSQTEYGYSVINCTGAVWFRLYRAFWWVVWRTTDISRRINTQEQCRRILP